MTIAYPLTSQNDYSELKYSLRSVEKFIPQPYEVLIIGDVLPEWLTGVTHITLPDVPGKKQLSIRRKILAALEYAEEVIFFNDDYFLLRQWDAVPYYWCDMLKRCNETGARPLEKKLTELNKPQKWFDIHYPIIYKQNFKEASQHFPQECIIKSMYANYFEIEGELMPDCKIHSKPTKEQFFNFVKDKPCVSTGVSSVNSVLPFLQILFPNKSNFEK